MVDPTKHDDARGVLESILRKIPGFRGYLEKEYRRESDHLARMWLADRLETCKAGVDRYQRSLLDARKIDFLDDCERVRTRLDTLASRVRGAMRGYSGLFDFVRVDEDLLDQVYELDLALVDEAEWLMKAVDEVLVPEKDPAAALAEFLKRVEELHRRFDRRSELLEGLGPSK
ncbi:MAG: hypothetical protein ABI614_08925 [Planctomycetota bacterium]